MAICLTLDISGDKDVGRQGANAVLMKSNGSDFYQAVCPDHPEPVLIPHNDGRQMADLMPKVAVSVSWHCDAS